MATNDMDSSSWPRAEVKEVAGFVRRCMLAVGTAPDHADALAELLSTADYRGHYSHGINRIDLYAGDIQHEVACPTGEPEILKQTVATAWVEGNNICGPAVGKFCIDLAIEKAKQAGIGWVVAKGSNHFGIAGWYSMRAAKQGLIGMAYCNSSPCLVPTRARERCLGSNPISVAAEGKNGDSLVLDMATATVAHGKLEIAGRRGVSIPRGWACDSSGLETHNPQDVLTGKGGLLPLGGVEESGGYKGYGLAMMVELFCSILGGAQMGPQIRHWTNYAEGSADLGQCFVAIDPSAFAPGFEDRISYLLDTCRNLQPAEGCEKVLVPGDPEREHMALVDKLGGIPYHPNQIQHLNEVAQNLGVEPLHTLPATA